MKIKALELFHISIPFAVPYKLSKVYGTLVNADAVILKVHTDQGIIGWGEADPMNPFTDETPATVMAVMRDNIAPHLLGRNPLPIAKRENRLDLAVHGHLLARGAVNMALFDILGKAHNLPAHTFLGGSYREKIPLLGPIGSGTPKEDTDAIETLLEQGYRTIMIKMGALPIDREIDRMKIAAQRFGGDINLIADANQGWQFKEAVRFVDRTAGSEPDMLEQPIAAANINGLKQIREKFAGQLSADESLKSIQDAAALIRTDAVDVFSIKVSKNGGLSKSMVLAKSAEAFGMKCLMNSMLEFGITQAASLQLGCTLANLVDMGHAYMSVLRMSDDITDFNRLITKAEVKVPSSPGLGVQVDEEKIKTYTRNHLIIE